jgi:hypothetical protein
VNGDGARTSRSFFARFAIPACRPRIAVPPQPDWSSSPAAAAYGEVGAVAQCIRAFNGALHGTADAHGARWINLGETTRRQAEAHEFAPDELHPSAKALDAWAAKIDRQLKP